MTQNQLITIHTTKEGDRTVNARDLHQFMEIGKDFSNWIKDRIDQYGFQKNQDFVIIENLSSPKSASAKARPQRQIDYHLSLDMAKELAMVERNHRGRQARRYFIECERRFRRGLGYRGPASDPAPLPKQDTILKDIYPQFNITPYVSEQNGKIIVTSDEVAKYFGVQPGLIHEVIENMECSDEFRAANFTFVPRRVYKEDRGPDTVVDTHYRITRDGFMAMVMNFPPEWNLPWCTEAFTKAFTKMDQKIYGPLRYETIEDALEASHTGAMRLAKRLERHGRHITLIDKIKKYRSLGLNFTETGLLCGISRQCVRDYETDAIACGMIRPVKAAPHRTALTQIKGGRD